MRFTPSVLLAILLGAAPTHACPLERRGGWGGFGSANGQFNFAHHLGIGPGGDVYVGDLLNNRVQHFTATGAFVNAWAVPGSDGVAVSTDGIVYVSGNDAILRFATDGGSLGRWGTTGSGPGQFQFPTDVAVDAQGFVYVADSGNFRIQKFTSTGSFVTQWGGEGTGDGQFEYGWGLAVDALGQVWAADGRNNRLEVFTADGAFVRSWGTLGAGDGQLNFPGKPGFDRDGNVIVPDNGNSRVQVFDPSGTFLCRWGSEGSGPEQLFHPTAVGVTGEEILVMDKDNYRIVRLGEVTGIQSSTWTAVRRIYRAP